MTVNSITSMCSVPFCNVLLINSKMWGYGNGVYLSNFHNDEFRNVLLLPVRDLFVADDDLVLDCADWLSFMGHFGKGE